MYPLQHAVISAAGTAAIAVMAGVDGLQFVIWTLIGAVSGVLIDVDHVFLAMIVQGRWKDGLDWLRHPVRAFTRPDMLLADIDYPDLRDHRLVSHFLILLAVVLISPIYPVLKPVAAGIGVHLGADIVWDVHNILEDGEPDV